MDRILESYRARLARSGAAASLDDRTWADLDLDVVFTDGELVDLLHETHVALHFGDSLGPEGLTFDYRLRTGPATSRNAITLLELQGAPKRLVQRANQRAAELDRERSRPPVEQ